MSDKFTLIESIVNENAVDFRQIVNKVLLEKLAVRLDGEYKNVAKDMFTISEAEENEEELEGEEEDTEDTEEGEEIPQQQIGGDRARRSYGAY